MGTLTNSEILEQCRLLVALRVIARVTKEMGGPPLQRSLISDEFNLFAEEWDALGLRREFPFGLDHVPQVSHVCQRLRDYGFLETEDKKRQGYVLSKSGRALAHHLGDNWRLWPGPDALENYAQDRK